MREMDMYKRARSDFCWEFLPNKNMIFFFSRERDVEKLKRFNVSQILIYRKFRVSKLLNF